MIIFFAKALPALMNLKQVLNTRQVQGIWSGSRDELPVSFDIENCCKAILNKLLSNSRLKSTSTVIIQYLHVQSCVSSQQMKTLL